MPLREEPRNAPDRSDAYSRCIVDFSIRHPLDERFDHIPPVHHCLKLGRCAEISKEILALLDVAEAANRVEQGSLGTSFLPGCQ